VPQQPDSVYFRASAFGPRPEVEISDTQNHLDVDPAALAELARLVLNLEGRPASSISIVLVNNATIHALNRQFLGHDWPTDVISFPLSAPEDAELAGELVVSTEMACAVAGETGINPHDELALYIVHGLLHLCGYDDHSEADALRMQERQRGILRTRAAAAP
jgi:probable rRNA maturation factor